MSENQLTRSAIGPIEVPEPDLRYEVSCPGLGYHGFETVFASSPCDAALRWARLREIKREISTSHYGLRGGVVVHVRAQGLDSHFRVTYEELPTYIGKLVALEAEEVG